MSHHISLVKSATLFEKNTQCDSSNLGRGRAALLPGAQSHKACSLGIAVTDDKAYAV